MGDIIQAFPVLEALSFSNVDWVVEEEFGPIVQAHPLIRRAYLLPIRGRRFQDVMRGIQELRKTHYDYVFDLQGNCKSGFITLCSRARHKVGFGWHSVREWPNALCTGIHVDVSRTLNIREQYLRVIQKIWPEAKPQTQGVSFRQEALVEIESYPSPRIVVCPGSKWVNKKLPISTWIEFLRAVGAASWFFIWGNEEERAECEELKRALGGVVVEKLALPQLQNLMSRSDLILAVDSGALHLAGTTGTATFSIFGPTQAEVFHPLGDQHGWIQGSCPYLETFEKQCSRLRNCPTGACIRTLTAGQIIDRFRTFQFMRSGGADQSRSPLPRDESLLES